MEGSLASVAQSGLCHDATKPLKLWQSAVAKIPWEFMIKDIGK